MPVSDVIGFFDKNTGMYIKLMELFDVLLDSC